MYLCCGIISQKSAADVFRVTLDLTEKIYVWAAADKRDRYRGLWDLVRAFWSPLLEPSYQEIELWETDKKISALIGHLNVTDAHKKGWWSLCDMMP